MLAAVMLTLCTVAAYALTHLFSGRGAYIHFGAMLGTIMTANVFFVIMPGQREMVKARADGRAPDPVHGARGKQRSVHNTYFTLPVLFTMISNHYALFTNAKWNWLVLMAIALAGVFIRLFFTFRHRGIVKPSFWAIGIALLAAVFVALMPRGAGTAAGKATFADVQAIVVARCARLPRRDADVRRLRCRAEERPARHERAHPRAVEAGPPADGRAEGDADRQPDADDRRGAREGRRVVPRGREGGVIASRDASAAGPVRDV